MLPGLSWLLCVAFIINNIGLAKENFRLIPQTMSVTSPTAKLYLLVDLKSSNNLDVTCSLEDLPKHGTRVRRQALDGHVLSPDSENIVQEDPTSIYFGTLGSTQNRKLPQDKLAEETKGESVEQSVTEVHIASESVEQSVTEVHIASESDVPVVNTTEQTAEETLNSTSDLQLNVTQKPQLSGVSSEHEGEIGAWKLLKDSYVFTPQDLLLPVDLEYNLTDACVQGALTIRCFTANNTSVTESLIMYDIQPLPNASAEDSTKERIYHLPQYVDIAPCPCDLIQGGCDTNCCCDEDCSALARGTFACSTKTRLEKLVSSRECEQGRNGMICIEDYTVPYIGHFHTNEPILQSLANYTKRVANLVAKRSNLSNEVEFDWPSHYKMGVPVQAIKHGIGSFWELPHQVVGSSCISFSPIFFLENMQSKCVRHINPGFCVQDQVFSVDSYVLGPEMALVSDLSNRNISSSSVLYCRVKSLSLYLQIREEYHDLKKMLPNDTIFTKCSRSETKPVTSLINNGIMCQNVVLEVHYAAVWRGQEIPEVEQIIVLSDVSGGKDIETSSSRDTLIQYFSVTFEHFAFPTHKTNCERGENTCEVELEDGFFTWQPDANGICKPARVRASMGESTSSSCWLIVDDMHLEDCAKYRSFLCHHQQTIVASAVHYSYVQTQNTSTVVLQKNNSCLEVGMNATNCDFLPVNSVIEVVYADQAAVAGAPSLFQILGVSVGFQPEPCLPCISETDMYCTKTTNHNYSFSHEETIKVRRLLSCTPRKRILLRSTVRFIVADLEAIAPIKEFWRRMFSSCPGGVCWWHLNEFTANIYYDQLLADSVQWIVALFAILVSLFVVSCGFSGAIR